MHLQCGLHQKKKQQTRTETWARSWERCGATLVSRASGKRNKKSPKTQITSLYPLYNQNKSGSLSLFTVNGCSHLSSPSKRLVLRPLAQCQLTNRRALHLALPATGKPIWSINLWVEEWRRGLGLAESLSYGPGPLNGALSAPQLLLSKLHRWALPPMSCGSADWTPWCSCEDVQSVCVCGLIGAVPHHRCEDTQTSTWLLPVPNKLKVILRFNTWVGCGLGSGLYFEWSKDIKGLMNGCHLYESKNSQKLAGGGSMLRSSLS